MKPQLIFSLYTPENPFVKKAPAREVSVPSVRGRLQILPGHAPLVSLLEEGVLNYRLINSEKSESAAVGRGYIEVTGEEVLVLAESLQGAKEAADRNA